MDGKQFENRAFRRRWHHENRVIFPAEFSSKHKSKMEGDCYVFKFLRRSVTGPWKARLIPKRVKRLAPEKWRPPGSKILTFSTQSPLRHHTPWVYSSPWLSQVKVNRGKLTAAAHLPKLTYWASALCNFGLTRAYALPPIVSYFTFTHFKLTINWVFHLPSLRNTSVTS